MRKLFERGKGIFSYSLWLIKVNLAIVRVSYRMTRHFFTLFAPLFVLLWIAGTNHCAIEYVFSGHAESSQGNCSSHPDKSPDSHNEGQPCSSKSLVSSTDSFVAKAKGELNLVVLASFSFLKTTLLESSVFNCRTGQPKNLEPGFYKGVLDSLSIASNAPPVTA